jgi:hypothetical protein
MKTSKNRNEQFESKPVLSKVEGAHGALHGHSNDGTTSHSTRLPAEELLAGHPEDGSQVAGCKLAKNRQISRWSAQRTRQHDAQRLVAVQTDLQVMSEPHTQWECKERAPRKAASERVAALPPGTHRPTPCGCIELRSRFVGVFK